MAAKRPAGSVKQKSGDTTLATLTHLLGFFTGFIGPLIVYFATKDDYTRSNAKTALNWQISLLIYGIVAFVLIFILIGILFVFVLSLINIIFCIMAAVKASNGEIWKYPLSIRFLK